MEGMQDPSQDPKTEKERINYYTSYMSPAKTPSTCAPKCSHFVTFLWTATGFVVFTIVWGCTDGGYHSSFPLFLFLFIYCYGTSIFKKTFCGVVMSNAKLNLNYLLKEDRQVVFLVISYLSLKVLLLVTLPDMENSNGSPLSLVLFTVLFIATYLLPTIRAIGKMCFIKKSCRFSVSFASNVSGFFIGLKQWKSSMAFTFLLFIITLVFDADISSILRYISKGIECWPVLIPLNEMDKLPYPLQHAWVKTWNVHFKNYRPSWLVEYCLHYGRELGEVSRLLPMLIGTYVLAQLILPQDCKLVKKTLFASIAGVVMGGVVSASFKILIHRYRPNAYGNPYMWTGPGAKVVNHWQFSKLDLSFPAGHTTVTSAVATCLFSTTMDNCKCRKSLTIWLILCFYFYPIVVLLSRVTDCYHWPSDASFGVSYFLMMLTSVWACNFEALIRSEVSVEKH